MANPPHLYSMDCNEQLATQFLTGQSLGLFFLPPVYHIHYNWDKTDKTPVDTKILINHDQAKVFFDKSKLKKLPADAVNKIFS